MTICLGELINYKVSDFSPNKHCYKISQRPAERRHRKHAYAKQGQQQQYRGNGYSLDRQTLCQSCMKRISPRGKDTNDSKYVTHYLSRGFPASCRLVRQPVHHLAHKPRIAGSFRQLLSHQHPYILVCILCCLHNQLFLRNSARWVRPRFRCDFTVPSGIPVILQIFFIGISSR